MTSKELTITLQRAKELYPTSDKTIQEIFENTFGKEEFVTDICEVIQSLEDVARINKKSIALPYSSPESKLEKSANAFILLANIAEAYNGGVTLDWRNNNQDKWLVHKYKTSSSWAVGYFPWWVCISFPASLYFAKKRFAEDAYKKFKIVFEDFWMI